MGPGWASPDPGLGMTIEMVGGDLGDEGNVVIVSQRLPGEGFAAEESPPPLNEIQPGGSYRNEGVLDPGMQFQPVPDRTAGVAGQVVRNQVEIAPRIGLVERLEQLEVAGGITGPRGLGQRLAISDRERPIDPHLGRSAVVVERHLDPVSVGRPLRCRRKIARGYRAELVDTQDRGTLGRVGVEADDAGSFGTKSGSLLLAHKRVCRQRTFS